MKALGLTGAGAAALAAASPVFHDLDELKAANNGHKLPWYVKQVDNTTAEYDWGMMQRYDKRLQYNPNTDTDTTGGYPNKTVQWMAEQAQQMKSYAQQGKPGSELKDLGILYGSCWGWIHEASNYWGFFTDENFRVVVPGGFQRPQEVGLSPHQDTPEGNAKMLRAALHYFGAAHVSFQELDSNRKKLIFSHDSGGRPYVFEDVDAPYKNGEKNVIPNKYKYVVSYLITQNMYTNKTDNSWDTYLGGAAVAKAYSELNHVQGRLMTFIRTLGYGSAGSNPGHVNGYAILGGQGELSRANMLIHPVYGLVGRVPNFVLTDLPVPTDKPIDFGAFRFCHDCKKCAELCPSASIQTTDEPSWDVTGSWNAGGVKTWYVDWKKCLPYRNMRYAGLCGNCQAVCVFSKFDEASIHELVKGVVATTGIFNGFFRQMDDAFGYKGQTSEEWWDREIPHRYDATHGRWW
jgi:reductive dehalogenase